MSLDDGSDESYFLCLRHFLFLSHFFFLDDESTKNGSGSGSSGTCNFPFFPVNSVGHFSYVGSGIFVPTVIESIGDIVLLIVFVPIGVESKVGQLIERFSLSKS